MNQARSNFELLTENPQQLEVQKKIYLRAKTPLPPTFDDADNNGSNYDADLLIEAYLTYMEKVTYQGILIFSFSAIVYACISLWTTGSVEIIGLSIFAIFAILTLLKLLILRHRVNSGLFGATQYEAAELLRYCFRIARPNE